VAVQVLILNNIQFLHFVNPYLYVLFIITLPTGFSRALSLVVAFLLGLSIDIFANTPGVHTFATVFAAFVQQPLLSLFVPREYEKQTLVPSMATLGSGAFFRYAALMILLHHTVLFVVEAFSFHHFGLLVLRIVASSIFTFILVFIIEYFKTNRR
jgi:rod shape-determining protein MreD